MYAEQLCLSSRGSLFFFINESYVRSVSRYCFIRNYAAIPVQLEVVFLQYVSWCVLIAWTFVCNHSSCFCQFLMDYYYIILYCIVFYRIVLHYINYIILYYITLYCIVFYRIVLHCINYIILYCIVFYRIVLHYIILYFIVLYYIILIILYYIILYYIILYYIILYYMYCIVFYLIVLHINYIILH